MVAVAMNWQKQHKSSLNSLGGGGVRIGRGPPQKGEFISIDIPEPMVPKLNIERMWRRVSQERRVVTRAKETYKTTEAQNDVTLYEFQIVPYD
jgi:hypothetical protein